VIAASMIRTRAFIPWNWVSDTGDWVVVLFGFLVCIVCLSSLFALGMRVIFAARRKSLRHKRRRQARQSI
jgi:uncharacterized protein (DUF2062 family)